MEKPQTHRQLKCSSAPWAKMKIFSKARNIKKTADLISCKNIGNI